MYSITCVYVMQTQSATTEINKMCEKHVCLRKPKCMNAVHINQRYTHAACAKHNTHGSLQELCGNNFGTFDSICYSGIICE